jgi:hypothetical protein
MGLTLAIGVKVIIGSGDGRGVEVGIGVLMTNTAVSCGVIVGEGDGRTLAFDGWQAAPSMVKHTTIPSRRTSLNRDVFIVMPITAETPIRNSALARERRRPISHA